MINQSLHIFKIAAKNSLARSALLEYGSIHHKAAMGGAA
jgi:hypothetical protein